MIRSLPLVLVTALLAAGETTYRTDVVYGQAEGVDLVLDLAQPANPTGPAPAIICIHGGAFIEGSRKHFAAVAKAFAREGFVAVTIDYRLAPRFPLPAQIQDAKCAVRYLRVNAASLGIDPKRIGAIGGSAGGQLALLLGLSGNDASLEGTGGNPGVSSQVQAVVSLAGATDMAAEAWNEPEVTSIFKASAKMTQGILFGSSPAPGLAERCSPINHVDAQDPPVLIMHGSADTVVPIAQSRRLHEKLDAAKVENSLVVLDGLNHEVANCSVKGVCGRAITFFQQQFATAR